MSQELESLLRTEIAASGPISFSRFMELALYHPQWGYYTAPDAPTGIGRRGDYFTSVSVGKVFGELLARQFAEMWEAMGRPAEFTLLELGAHRGQLASDVTAWVQRERPDFHAALRYIARDYPGELLNTVTGCIFSNEFFDSLPVRRIKREQGEWREILVTTQNGRLAFATGLLPMNAQVARLSKVESAAKAQPASTLESRATFTASMLGLSTDKLRAEVARLPLPDVDGYTTEVHCEARQWMGRLACALARGFVLTIDYGYVAEDYYAPHRKDGTLLCYHEHRANKEPLARIGEQDITAHVNFTALVEEGAAWGLEPVGLTDQGRFIIGLLKQAGEATLVELGEQATAQLKTLLHPEFMGRTFKVLVQQRGMEGAELSGLRFAV